MENCQSHLIAPICHQPSLLIILGVKNVFKSQKNKTKQPPHIIFKKHSPLIENNILSLSNQKDSHESHNTCFIQQSLFSKEKELGTFQFWSFQRAYYPSKKSVEHVENKRARAFQNYTFLVWKKQQHCNSRLQFCLSKGYMKHQLMKITEASE